MQALGVLLLDFFKSNWLKILLAILVIPYLYKIFGGIHGFFNDDTYQYSLDKIENKQNEILDLNPDFRDDAELYPPAYFLDTSDRIAKALGTHKSQFAQFWEDEKKAEAAYLFYNTTLRDHPFQSLLQFAYREGSTNGRSLGDDLKKYEII